jgi:hypothetical protein
MGPTLKGMAVSLSFEVVHPHAQAARRPDQSSTTTVPFMNAWKAHT